MGDVIGFRGPPDFDLIDRKFPLEEARWSPKQRHFMNPGSWRMRFDIRLDRHLVTTFDSGGDMWRWRVLHMPTEKVLWSTEIYPSFKAARRGCWAAKWPGERGP
jgi:hypothetical protein